jgi:DNA-binding HxlR family transcriptional regulator
MDGGSVDSAHRCEVQILDLRAVGQGIKLGCGVAGYSQFCPVSLGAEVFAERWTPLILRELLDGSHRFSELQRGLPRISRNLLSQRLVSLEQKGLIEQRPRAGGGHEYFLTPAGEDLGPVVTALGAWGYRWSAAHLQRENLDAGLLLWFMYRRIDVEKLPERRLVVRFDFRRPPKRPFYWLVLDRPRVDLCFTDPGFPVDLQVSAELEALTRVYLGYLSPAEALRQGKIELTGSRAAGRSVAQWIPVCPFAPAAA